MGAGLGGLRQHVCRAARHVADVLRRGHAAVPHARPLARSGRRVSSNGSAVRLRRLARSPAAGADSISACQPWLRYRRQPLPVLEDVSLLIEPGELVSLLGPSGCGKSPCCGSSPDWKRRRPAPCGRRRGGIRGPRPSRVVVFQDPTLYPWRTVWANVALGLEARASCSSQRHRVDEALDLVGLTAFANAYPHQLSGGMAQRVALARALVNDPKMLHPRRAARQTQLADPHHHAGRTGLAVATQRLYRIARHA